MLFMTYLQLNYMMNNLGERKCQFWKDFKKVMVNGAFAYDEQ